MPAHAPVEFVKTTETAQGKPATFPVGNAVGVKLERTTAVSPMGTDLSVARGISVEAVGKTSKRMNAPKTNSVSRVAAEFVIPVISGDVAKRAQPPFVVRIRANVVDALEMANASSALALETYV